MKDFEDEEYEADSDKEEYEEMLRTWEDDEDNSDDEIPELYFCNTDPFSKREALPPDHPRRNYRIDEDGRIVVRNLSAWWIPEMKIMEEIDGTLYTVTGSYEGTEMLSSKLTRIMLHNSEDF